MPGIELATCFTQILSLTIAFDVVKPYPLKQQDDVIACKKTANGPIFQIGHMQYSCINDNKHLCAQLPLFEKEKQKCLSCCKVAVTKGPKNDGRDNKKNKRGTKNNPTKSKHSWMIYTFAISSVVLVVAVISTITLFGHKMRARRRRRQQENAGGDEIPMAEILPEQVEESDEDETVPIALPGATVLLPPQGVPDCGMDGGEGQRHYSPLD